MATSAIFAPASDTPTFEAIHARVFRFFSELVNELGGDPEALRRRVGMPEQPGTSESASYRQQIQLMELAAEELHCPDFGMRLAQRQKGGDMFGPLGLAMRNSRTWGDALDFVSTHTYAHSLAAHVWQMRFPADGTVFFGHEILLDRLSVKTQAIEQIMLNGHLAAMEITGGRARVRRVHFRHQPVSAPRAYCRYFGCEVRFGQSEDGVLFTEQDLVCPIVEADSQAHQRAAAYIDQQFVHHRRPLHAEARGVIMRYLRSEDCTNDRVAAELNLHPRTLHRRLRAEGTSFQRIKDEVRRDVMLYYLQQTKLDLSLISERLGFAEQSVMTRCCQRWFTASPTGLRAKGSPLR